MGPREEPTYTILVSEKVPFKRILFIFPNQAHFDIDTSLQGFFTTLAISLSFPKIPSKGAPPTFPTGSTWTGTHPHQSHCSMYTFIHSCYVCRSSQKGPATYIEEKHKVAVHVDPRRRKAYTQRDAAWFPKQKVYETAISTTVPCGHQHDTVLLGLGKPAPR